MERFDEAIGEYNIAIKLRPGFAEAYNNLGYVYLKQSNYNLAIINFKKAIEQKPGYIGAYNNLGQAYLKVGMRDKAREQYDIVHELTSKSK
jgi:tetratricopeptide (TPR) repeat protein